MSIFVCVKCVYICKKCVYNNEYVWCVCVNRKKNDNQKNDNQKKNILKKKSDVGQTSESGGDLETQKNKKYIQTLYFCVWMYMNYFNKVVYVMYIRVKSNNIKATIIKSNVQKK